MKRIWSALLCAMVSGCDGTLTGGTGGGSFRITVVNSAITMDAVTLHVDGHFGSNIGTGNAHSEMVNPGTHTIDVRVNGVTAFTRQVTEATAMVVFDSSGFLRPSVLSDTGAIVPANKSKLRVAHFAQAAGAIDIWRTQPDFPTPVRVMFPFAYGDESTYIQSDPGEWRIMVSTAVANPGDPMPDTLANSGLINVPAGTSRTVVLVKTEAGQFQFAAIDP